MTKDPDRAVDPVSLRRQAEARLRSRQPERGPRKTADDTARLVHELEVHQIELEMQNEELQRTRAETEALLARYTDLYDFAPVGYFTLARDGTILAVNLAGANCVGFPRTQVVNRRFAAFIAVGRSEFDGFLTRVFADQTVQVVEVHLAVEGQPPLTVQIRACVSADGRSCLAAVTDIAERKLAEEAVRDAEARYRMLFEQSPDGIVILDAKTMRVLEFNEAAHRQLGYSREEYAQLRISDFEAVESPDATAARIAKLMSEGRHDFETRHRTRSGEIRDIHVTAQITRDASGRQVSRGIFRDITERKQAEAALHQRNADLEAALAQVKTLSGLLPICSGCKKIRDDQGYWSHVESYVSKHTGVQFSHGLCPACVKDLYGLEEINDTTP